MRSIQARLGIGLGSSLVILFLLQWAIVNYTLRHLTEEILIDQLRHDADSLIAALVVVNSGKISLPFAAISDVYHRPFSGLYYRIDGPENTLRSRSLWDADLEIDHFDMNLGEENIHHLLGPLHQPLTIFGIKFKKRGQIINIHVAHDITDTEQDISDLQINYASISLSALLILLYLQVETVQRGLKPLEAAKKQLVAMRRGEVSELHEDVPAELKPMVREINRLVSLLSQRISRSRNALGNLAHALKAPLSVLKNVATSNDLKQFEELNHSLLTQTDNMRQLVDRELKRARLAGISEPGKYFDLTKDIEPLISTLESVYRSKDLAMDINIPENISCSLDREDMMELVGNILENACKFAKVMVRFTIMVSDEISFCVEDDGPGVAEDKISELLKRGVRIDESTIGHGLGLAIVKDAVDHYKGRIEMGRSNDLGGFMIKIILPLAKYRYKPTEEVKNV